MVTNPEAQPDEPTKADLIREQAEASVRLVVAGSEAGAVRRIILYVVVALALVGAPPIVAGLGLIALLLLGLTDQFR